MYLKFVQEYKSIKKIDDIELNGFSIITGDNGAGKSQLLEAIEKSSNSDTSEIEVRETVDEDSNSLQTQLFTYLSFSPQTAEETRLWDEHRRALSDGGEVYNILHYDLFLQGIVTQWQKIDIQEFIKSWPYIQQKLINKLEQFHKKSNLINFSEFTLFENIFQPFIQLREGGTIGKDVTRLTARSLLSNFIAMLRNNLKDIQNPIAEVIKYIENYNLKEKLDDMHKKIDAHLIENKPRLYKNIPKAKHLLDLEQSDFALLTLTLDKLATLQKDYIIKKKTAETANIKVEEEVEPPINYLEEINQFMNEISLNDYQFAYKDKEPIPKYGKELPLPQIVLRNKRSELADFSTLSSGEKTLLAMIIAMFEIGHQKKSIPELVLFDEVEQSLHPKMIKYFLDQVVVKQLIKKGSKIILVTHSPTTIAVASILEERPVIYEMTDTNDGIKKLQEISPEKAIASLLDGVREIKISKQKQKVIYCESFKDKEHYEKLFAEWKIHRSCNSSIYIKFDAIENAHDTAVLINKLKQQANKLQKLIEAKKANGEDNVSTKQSILTDEFLDGVLKLPSGGKDKIKQYISNERKTRPDVYGLIDWDGKEKESDGIYVLVENSHYGKENLICDPFLLLCYILKTGKRYTGNVLKSHLKNKQKISELIETEILNKLQLSEDINLDEKGEYTYGAEECEFTLKLPKQLFEMNGHDYIRAITRSGIPVNNQEDGLIESIIDEVLYADNLEYVIPKELDNLFQKLVMP